MESGRGEIWDRRQTTLTDAPSVEIIFNPNSSILETKCRKKATTPALYTSFSFSFFLLFTAALQIKKPIIMMIGSTIKITTLAGELKSIGPVSFGIP